MKVLPKLNNIELVINDKNIELTINESNKLLYNVINEKDNEILSDLIEHKAFATTFLFLNENYKLSISKDSLVNESNISDFYKDCEDLLNENIKVVTEQGPLLTSIKGYPIYEVENGILRGNGEKKIFESFEEMNENITKELEESENWTEDELQKASKYMKKLGNMSYEEFKKELELAKEGKSNKIKIIKEEGTQVSDIAPKLDQSSRITKPKAVSTKINGLKENISLRGFLRNELGQYERNNYILCQENDKYIVLNKNILK